MQVHLRETDFISEVPVTLEVAWGDSFQLHEKFATVAAQCHRDIIKDASDLSRGSQAQEQLHDVMHIKAV